MYLLEDTALCGYLLSNVQKQAFLLQHIVSLWRAGEDENQKMLKQVKKKKKLGLSY